MMKRYLLLFVTVFGIGVFNGTAQQYSLSLDQCFQYALGNNFQRQSMLLSEKSGQVIYDQSKNERLPNLNATASEGLHHTQAGGAVMSGNVGLSSNVILYNGGNISNTIEQNKLVLEQSSYKTTQYENQLMIKILQAFLNTLGNEELLKYQQAVVQASAEQLNQGKAQFEVGSILESDYLLLQSQYMSDSASIIETNIARDNSLLTLKGLLSMEPTDTLAIIAPDTSMLSALQVLPPQSEVLTLAEKNLPDFKINEYNTSIAKMSVQLAEASYKPTLSLGASIGTGHSTYESFGNQVDNQFNQQVGLTLNVPIFNRGENKAKVLERQIALEQTRLDQRQSDLSIRQTIATQYQGVLSASNKYRASDIKQKAYLKTFEVYNAQFNAGSITAVDLLQQQNNYISSLNDFIQNKYGFILQRKILDVYMGTELKKN